MKPMSNVILIKFSYLCKPLLDKAFPNANGTFPGANGNGRLIVTAYPFRQRIALPPSKARTAGFSNPVLALPHSIRTAAAALIGAAGRVAGTILGPLRSTPDYSHNATLNLNIHPGFYGALLPERVWSLK